MKMEQSIKWITILKSDGIIKSRGNDNGRGRLSLIIEEEEEESHFYHMPSLYTKPSQIYQSTTYNLNSSLGKLVSFSLIKNQNTITFIFLTQYVEFLAKKLNLNVLV